MRNRVREASTALSELKRLRRTIRQIDQIGMPGSHDPLRQGSLRIAIREYLVHYHAERNHQGLSNQRIIPITTERKSDGAVQRKQRLGGSLNYYYRDAA